LAQIYGFLREDATYGENKVLESLKHNLPRDFSVYVECPLETHRMQRFPDFIVVTNYGAVVLEVKDWVQIIRASPHEVRIRNRHGQEIAKQNPVRTARKYAIALEENLREVPELLDQKRRLEVPWGYAVIFPNIGTAVTSQLRVALGEHFVFGKADLGPNIILKKLKQTIPEGFNATLSGEQLRLIRAVINPTVLIEPEDRPAIILDPVQEKLVVEPVVEKSSEFEEQVPEPQMKLMQDERSELEPIPDLLPEEENLVGKLSVRLVRGVAGSGKSLVLIQRAKFLASKFPDWNILVVTFNKALAARLSQGLIAHQNIRTVNFHKLCREMIVSYRSWKLKDDLQGWLSNHEKGNPIFDTFGIDFLKKEIKWIKENGITTITDYQTAVRRGRGTNIRVTQNQRQEIFSLKETYQSYLNDDDAFDWFDVPWVVLKGIKTGSINVAQFDAILIDEAQDFAPSWMRVMARLVKESIGSIFIADDPTQSIYRFFSWKEKGIQVVGRTRWLRVPYRNTREIFQAAFSIIKANQNLCNQINAEGELLIPDIDNQWIRSGPRPLISQFDRMEDDLSHIKSRVHGLLQDGISASQIAVLSARKNHLRTIRQTLNNDEIAVNTFYQFKGLEYQYIFLAEVQELFRSNIDTNEISRKLRLMYMGMTRARESLFINYRGPLPSALTPLLDYCDHIT